jgi:NADPH:quinone reductase-like Zn-dependent oxidoreductase
MKAFIVDKYGKGLPLRLAELPVPEVGERDVLVRIVASGVNPLDAKIRDGEFKIPLPYKTPFVLGNDLAGVVEAVGTGVRDFAVGQEVYARPDKDRIGTFAEYLSVSQDDLALKPVNLTMAEAASLPLVALTAWQALVERANVQSGQMVLIHAGAGGVGRVAIQLAKHLGAHVATTVSGADVELVQELGADVVVDYRTQQFQDVLADYDVVLDSLGADSVLKSLTVLRPGGLVIGIAGPPDPDLASYLGKPVLRPVLALTSRKVRSTAKKLGVRYTFLFMRASGQQLAQLTELVEAGVLRTHVERTFNFADTSAALDHVDSGQAKGKVVVTMPSAQATSATSQQT